jgi:hypothetical protein
MKVGDEVIGSNGHSTIITGVFPRGIRLTYRVEFDDGFGVEVSDDHLWEVHNPHFGKRILSTKSMLSKLPLVTQPGLDSFYLDEGGRPKWNIPIVAPVHYAVSDLPLPIPPYTLGVFAQCACLQKDSVYFRVREDRLKLILGHPDFSRIFDELRDELRWSNPSIPSNEYECKGQGFSVDQQSLLTSLCKIYGIKDKESTVCCDFELNDVYLRSSIESRVALLQGILDSSGIIEEKFISLFSHSKSLSNSIVELVQSLGGLAVITAHKGGDSYRCAIRISLPSTIKPFSSFSLQTQYSLLREKYDMKVRSIVKIAPLRFTDVMCISVSAVNHLYVTENFIVTHNTIQVHYSNI